jgi:hypothetical protein
LLWCAADDVELSPRVGDDGGALCCRKGAFATLRIQRGQLFTRSAAVEGVRMLLLGLLMSPPS